MRKSSLNTLGILAKPARSFVKHMAEGESPRSAVANVAMEAVGDYLEALTTKALKAPSKAKRAPKVSSSKRASKAKRAPKASSSKRAAKASLSLNYCPVCQGPHRKHARRGVAT